MTDSPPFKRTYDPPNVRVIDKQVNDCRYKEVCEHPQNGYCFRVEIFSGYVGDNEGYGRRSGVAEVFLWWDGKWQESHALLGEEMETPRQPLGGAPVSGSTFKADRDRLLTVAAEIVGVKP